MFNINIFSLIFKTTRPKIKYNNIITSHSNIVGGNFCNRHFNYRTDRILLLIIILNK